MRRLTVIVGWIWIIGATVWAAQKPVQREIRNVIVAVQGDAIDILLQLQPLRKRSSAPSALPYEFQKDTERSVLTLTLQNVRSRVKRLPRWNPAIGLENIEITTRNPCQPTCTTDIRLTLAPPLEQWQYALEQKTMHLIVHLKRVRRRPPPPPLSEGEGWAGRGFFPEYRLGPGDLIEIQVFELPDFTTSVRIAPDGSISLVPIGRIFVAGKTVQELERELQARLARDYIQDPHVAVNIKEFQSQRYTVIGAVKNPGSFLLLGHKTLLPPLRKQGV